MNLEILDDEINIYGRDFGLGFGDGNTSVIFYFDLRHHFDGGNELKVFAFVELVAGVVVIVRMIVFCVVMPLVGLFRHVDVGAAHCAKLLFFNCGAKRVVNEVVVNAVFNVRSIELTHHRQGRVTAESFVAVKGFDQPFFDRFATVVAGI